METAGGSRISRNTEKKRSTGLQDHGRTEERPRDHTSQEEFLVPGLPPRDVPLDGLLPVPLLALSVTAVLSIGQCCPVFQPAPIAVQANVVAYSQDIERRRAEPVLAHEPIHRDQALADRIDREEKTFESDST